MNEEWETVLGLEVHAQLRTRSKAFCGCAVDTAAAANTRVCPVCLGLPGSLPVPNAEMVRLGVRVGLALGARVRSTSGFARKNYFYPDLPKGYQITQHEEPLCEGGTLTVPLDDTIATVELQRMHLEEDAGKSLHESSPPRSLVDFNRCGVPLLEIVTAPTVGPPELAVAYLKELRLVLLTLGVCDGNMEEGSFRCDANLSVRPAGAAELGTRTEIKNLNSFRHILAALRFERTRHIETLTSGGTVEQETRAWDADRGLTVSLRGKEQAPDYRYFPEPDIPPLVVSDDLVEEERQRLPELPAARRQRFRTTLGLTAQQSDTLCADPALADYFEAALTPDVSPSTIANWVVGELLGALHRDGRSIARCPVSSPALNELVRLVEEGRLSGKMAKAAFREVYEEGVEPAAIAHRLGPPIDGQHELEAAVDAVLAAHPDEVAAYRAGRRQLLGWFVGRVMERTQGRAEPRQTNEILRARLDG